MPHGSFSLPSAVLRQLLPCLHYQLLERHTHRLREPQDDFERGKALSAFQHSDLVAGEIARSASRSWDNLCLMCCRCTNCAKAKENLEDATFAPLLLTEPTNGVTTIVGDRRCGSEAVALDESARSAVRLRNMQIHRLLGGTALILAVAAIGVWACGLMPGASHETANSSNERYGELAAKAQRNGYVRVIVTVQLLEDATDAGARSDAKHRQAIANAEDNLITRLKVFNATVNARLENSPVIGLSVDATALRELVTWPEVVRVDEEQLIPRGF
jgi:hypothetical protein